MSRRIVTDQAPQAIGPYSQGIQHLNAVYTSGQVAIDPATGKLLDADVARQTYQALMNVRAILAAGGKEMSHIVKTTVFLTTMSDFKAMNEVYATFFPGDPPARSTVAVKELPLGALVEIEAIAL